MEYPVESFVDVINVVKRLNRSPSYQPASQSLFYALLITPDQLNYRELKP